MITPGGGGGGMNIGVNSIYYGTYSLSGKTIGWPSSVRVFVSFPTIVFYAIEDGHC